jgi:hypothetical protein
MSKEKISNEVLVERLDNLNQTFHEKLDRILEQAEKTNSKVIENTEFRIMATTAIKIIQYALGIGAVELVVLSIKVFGM